MCVCHTSDHRSSRHLFQCSSVQSLGCSLCPMTSICNKFFLAGLTTEGRNSVCDQVRFTNRCQSISTLRIQNKAAATTDPANTPSPFLPLLVPKCVFPWLTARSPIPKRHPSQGPLPDQVPQRRAPIGPSRPNMIDCWMKFLQQLPAQILF